MLHSQSTIDIERQIHCTAADSSRMHNLSMTESEFKFRHMVYEKCDYDVNKKR